MVSNNMLSDITFEQIEGNFWYAAYGPFRVIMMKDCGYINATKLCSSGGKDYKLWARNSIAKELIESLSIKMNGVQASEITYGNFKELDLPLQHTDGTIIPSAFNPCKTIHTSHETIADKLISGTYCHPLLVPHIACWVSADFAIMVSELVNGCISQEYKYKLNAMQLQLEQTTKSKIEADKELANQQIELDMLTQLELQHRRAYIISEIMKLDATLAKTKAEEDARKKGTSNSNLVKLPRLHN